MWNNSDFSVSLKLKRTDQIAPVSPLVKASYHTESTIVVHWINSSSDDIATKHLIRSSSSGKVVVKPCSGTDTTTLIEVDVVPGIIYSTVLILADRAQNTIARPFPSLNYSTRVRPAIENFTGTADLEKRTTTIKWDLPATPVDRFIIYKGKEGDSIRPFKTSSGTTIFSIDNQRYTSNIYTYRIRTLLKDGIETKMGEVEVQF